MIEIGIASDNFRHEDRPVDYVFRWCREQGCRKVELNTVNGFDFFEGIGFSPAVSLSADAMALRRQIEAYDLKVSQLDCHYPIHLWQCIPYMVNGIKMAHALGCPYIATTDGAMVPEGMTLEHVYDRAVYHIGEVLAVARSYGVGVNVEPHGPLTNHREMMLKLMKHFDGSALGVNFDTGNTFIAGNDNVAMAEELLPWIRHFHVKDVAPELQKQVGADTGIAASEVYVGQGVNADNIQRIVDMLKAKGWEGVMTLETRGEVNTLKSLEWFRQVVHE